MNEGQTTETLMTVGEVALRLKMSRQTVYRMVEAKEIPCLRPRGRAIRIPSAGLDQFMRNIRSHASTEQAKV